MGFPNVDKILVAIFKQKFADLKTDPSITIDDLFEDLEAVERAEITSYIQRKKFQTDIRERKDSSVFLLTTFPLLDLPMPQISVTLGQEDTDRYMGDQAGQTDPVFDGEGVQTGWDIIKGFYAKSSWNISVLTATKDEAIWLTRLCQLFIFESMLELEEKGVTEVNLAIADIRLEQDQLPQTIFSRSIRLSATTLNSWRKRIPMTTYTTGVNTGLQ